MNARLQKGERLDFSFSPKYTTMLLVLQGALLINGTEKASEHNLATFAYEGEDFFIDATEDALVLVMSAEPI